jgi:hypothetical protein
LLSTPPLCVITIVAAALVVVVVVVDVTITISNGQNNAHGAPFRLSCASLFLLWQVCDEKNETTKRFGVGMTGHCDISMRE